MRKEMDVINLTVGQRDIWFDQELQGHFPLYNIGGYVRIQGVVDFKVLTEVLSWLVAENSSLRTRIVLEKGQPCQYFPDHVPCPVQVSTFPMGKRPMCSPICATNLKFPSSLSTSRCSAFL
jgi:Condensation domain